MDGVLTDTSAKAAAESWLGDFAAALASGDAARLAALFAARMPLARHPRLHLGPAHDLRRRGHRRAAGACRSPHGAARADARRRAARRRGRVTRAGTDAIEAIFTFETAIGPCNGVVRLVSEGGKPRAWTLMTALDEIRGHEDPANGKRWQNVDWKRNFGGENWARPPPPGRRLRRSRSRRAGGGRRAGGAVDRRAAQHARRRYAGDRPRAAHRRFLAPPLPRADAAQRDAGQSPPLHAVPALLAGVHSEGHAGELVRALCRGDGAERLDRHGTRPPPPRTRRRSAGP